MPVKNRKKIVTGLYLVCFLFSLAPFIPGFFSKKAESKSGHKHEKFDPALVRLNTSEKLVSYIDSIYNSYGLVQFDTVVYVNTVSEVIKNRFHHGLTHYSLSDNWIAALGSDLFWSHLSAIVSTDDILKYPEGLCSQQTIVFFDVLRQKGISYRSVGLGNPEGPGHFLAEVYYKGSWHLFDVTMEPEWDKIRLQHENFEYYRQYPDSLFSIYTSKFTRKDFDKIMNKVVYGKVNEIPAARMKMFHTVTLIVVYLLPIVFLCLLIVSVLQKKGSTEKVSSYPVPEKVKEELVNI